MMRFTFYILIIANFHSFSWAEENLQSMGKSLENYKVIMVKSKSFHQNPIFKTDYSDHIQYFKKYNLIENHNYEIIETDSNDSPEFAARDVVKAIRDSRLKVILWANDKSSVDSLEALLSYPGLQNKVAGLINVQGAVAGAKQAINSRPSITIETNQIAAEMPLFLAFRYWINFLYSYIEQENSRLYPINPLVRDDYLKIHKADLDRLNKKVKVISIGERKDPYFVIPGSEIVFQEKASAKIYPRQDNIESILKMIVVKSN